MSKRNFILITITIFLAGNGCGYGLGYLNDYKLEKILLAEQRAQEAALKEEEEALALQQLQEKQELEALIKEAESEAIKKEELAKLQELERLQEDDKL